MSDKIYISSKATPSFSQIGATLEALGRTISTRWGTGEESYTHRLLTESSDEVLKKIVEEACEVVLAAKDVDAAQGAGQDDRATEGAVDHLRYEAADVVYHLLVALERYGISLDEFAAELNMRMTDAECPKDGVRLYDDHVKRGKQ